MKNLLVAFMLLFSLSASAQMARSTSTSFFSTERADASVSFGVRAGYNMSTWTSSDFDNLKTLSGFNVGLNVDIPILQSLYFQTGLYYSQKGAKEEYSENGYNIKDTYTPAYLQIPILASYRYDFSESTQLQVNFGPYLAYGIGGKAKSEWSNGNSSASDKTDFFGSSSDVRNDKAFTDKKFDMGFIVGAGVTVSKFYIGMNYEFGSTNLFNSDDDGKYSIKNSTLSLNVGYNF